MTFLSIGPVQPHFRLTRNGPFQSASLAPVRDRLGSR
jgi:hypothetical protein